MRFGGLGSNGHGVQLSGGSNWVFTGRYDAVAATGDAAFPGHDAGYVDSQLSYGILIDAEFEFDGNSGVIAGQGATDFEISFAEITRVGFAGALAGSTYS